MKPSRRALSQTIAMLAGDRELPTDQRASISAVLESVRSQLSDRSIRGVAIARKQVSGDIIDDVGLVFFVETKQPRAALDARLLIPPVLIDPYGRSILTDVRQVGDVMAQANVAASPIRSGFSIGHPLGRTGTLAAIVWRAGRPHLLSAQHVFSADDRAAKGDAIVYPGATDGGTRIAGALASFASFDRAPGFPNTVDAALAALDESRLGDVDPVIPGTNPPLSTAKPAIGMRVRLIGRSSGETRSIIKSVNALIRLRYPGLGYLGFSGQVECAPYTIGGDSGALVLDDTGAVVGLHIGGSSDASFFTPIDAVIRALKFNF